jgi:tetratricopeptide (TPR) repeat protein
MPAMRVRDAGARPGTWWLLLATAACATAPITAPDAEQRLARAEAHVIASAWDEALVELTPLEGEACPKRLRDRRDFAIASARHGLGEPWEAFQVLEPFPDLYPHSDLRPLVVEKVWAIGEQLSQSDRGFLFFWSDARAARTVLEHLITRHPDTQRLADALRILGDMAFADEDFELAQQRYRDLMMNRPDSEWNVYAQYRFAMSIVASLEGPAYDLDRLQHAERELRVFLATNPENPEIMRVGTETLTRLVAWRLERHLRIASFYRTIDNADGERHHLEIAVRPEFAAAPRYQEALDAREALARRATAAGGTKP